MAADSADVGHRWVVAVMRKRGPALVRMLWRILGNEADVCDAYQDTFLQLASRDGGKRIRRPEAFLFRTASNVAISMLRQRQVRSRALGILADSAQPFAGGNEGGELDAEHLCCRLRRDLARLPDNLRNVVILRDLADMPYRQVAKILGLSVATARVYRCRGVQLLGDLMMRADRGSAPRRARGESDDISQPQ